MEIFTTIVWLNLIIFIQNVDSYKILGVVPTISKSHFIVAEALFKGLANKGHNVTVFTTFPSKISMNNYQEFAVPTVEPPSASMLIKESGSIVNTYKIMPLLTDMSIVNIQNLLTEPNLKNLMDTESFDLVILEVAYGNALMGLGAHFNCPIVVFQSFNPTYAVHSDFGNPLALSYLSNPWFPFGNILSFKSRVKNMLAYFADQIFIDALYYRKHKRTYENFFPTPQYPLYDEMLKNISLFLVSTHFSQDNVRPNVPSIIEVGGIHIPDNNSSLPDDLQKWMDDSTNGIIYFSLGSNMPSSELPTDILNDIAKMFGSLTMNVLWKFENNTYQFPKNIRTSKWFPQYDVLQHKNLKLFITHGGLGSTVEAAFYGVPLIVIPLFTDQMGNAHLVMSQGWGVQIQFFDLNSETLSKSIHEVVTNPKYADRAKEISKIYRDRPNTAMETGIFWVEYVIRHHGAKQLKSNGIHLNFFQYHSLDVIGFLTLTVLVLVLIVYKSFSFVVRQLFKPNKIKTQ